MKGCVSNPARLALLIGALAAPAARCQQSPEPELALQRAREALFEKRPARAAKLCAEVVVLDPANRDARSCLREAARLGAGEEVLAVQTERALLLKRTGAARVATDEAPADCARLGACFQGYERVFAALDAAPGDPDALERLAWLQRTVAASYAVLAAQGVRAYTATVGFEFFTRRDYGEARRYWLLALQLGPDGAGGVSDEGLRAALVRLGRSRPQAPQAPGSAP